MDTVAAKLAAYDRERPDADGECWAKVELVKDLQELFDDPRVVAFYLRLIADADEHDLARVELLKFLELDPPATPAVRAQFAEGIAAALPGEPDETVRRWLAMATAGYADLQPTFQAAASRLRDTDEDEDMRFNCLAAMKSLGPTDVVLRVLADVAAGSDDVADSARRQLALPPARHRLVHRTPIRFAIGFVLGLLGAVSANLMPYLASRNAFMTDGYQVAGFPFTFQRRGGYVFTYQFHAGLMCADLSIGLAIAAATGIVAVVVLRHVHRRPAGFPVIDTSHRFPRAE